MMLTRRLALAAPAALVVRPERLRWDNIENAPTDGSAQIVYVTEACGLPAFITRCAYPWCADEVRPVTHYVVRDLAR
jgi:hypothetical protein